MDAEGRITQEVLGNGLITRRDYDPGTGHLLSIKTGGSIFSGSGINDADIQDVGPCAIDSAQRFKNKKALHRSVAGMARFYRMTDPVGAGHARDRALDAVQTFLKFAPTDRKIRLERAVPHSYGY